MRINFAVLFASLTSPNLFAQLDTVPEFKGRTCISEVFCLDTGTCLVKPIKFTCEATSKVKLFPYLFYKFDVDYNSDGNIDLSGTSQVVTLDAGNGLVPGKHKITWFIRDISNITNKCEKLFEVKDCVKPTIQLKNVVKKQVVPSGCSWNFRTTDLIDGASDNCTPNSKLRYRIYNGEKHNLTLENVLALKDSLLVESPLTTTYVTVYVLDEANNINTRIIQIDMDYQSCSVAADSVGIQGTLKTEAGVPLPQVTVFKDSILQTKSNIDGVFSFSLASGSNAQIAPQRLTAPRNGVTTADLVAINKHILGVDSLRSAYQRIAADVTEDRKISVADMIEIRRLILFLIDDFSSAKSWKFIPQNYKFGPKAESEPYPLTVLLTNVQKDTVLDFIAVKIGDTNGSANEKQVQDATDRHNTLKILSVANQGIYENSRFQWTIPVSDLPLYDGFQLAMTLDPSLVDLIDVDGLDSESYSWDPATGLFLVSYVAGLSTGSTLSLGLHAKKTTTLSTCIRFDNTWFNNEYYDQGQAMAMDFRFVEEASERCTIQPNPFATATSFYYYTAIPELIECGLFDLNGRLVWSNTCRSLQGWNELRIDGNELPGGGTYYIQAKMEQGVLTEKLIYLR